MFRRAEEKADAGGRARLAALCRCCAADAALCRIRAHLVKALDQQARGQEETGAQIEREGRKRSERTRRRGGEGTVRERSTWQV